MTSVSFMYAECMLEVGMKYRRGYLQVYQRHIKGISKVYQRLGFGTLDKLSNNSKIRALSKLPNIILLILIKERNYLFFNKNIITTLFFYSFLFQNIIIL